jgi:hypothetical protein
VVYIFIQFGGIESMIMAQPDKRFKRLQLFILFLLLAVLGADAHPMPNSIVNLSVLESVIEGEAKVPLYELQSAMGNLLFQSSNNDKFYQYFQQHIVAFSNNIKWQTTIDSIKLVESIDPIVGKYQEILVYFNLRPPAIQNLRKFTFNYDGVIHQVINHKILVFVHQDWINGINGENDAKQIGIIQLDIPSGKIIPLEVSLEKGSLMKGFNNMFKLGMNHIKNGTDHLLFLLVLLFPSMLVLNGSEWGGFGGIKYSIIRIITIVTSFTIGHSITLLIGAIGWLKLPQQPIEVLIALSILVSSVHAVKPIFYNKEFYIASGFGLIHGLAFASILTNLHLGGGTMALSILGFNLGIESMQLFIVLLIVPWMIMLSSISIYKLVRFLGSSIAAVASMAWIVERVKNKQNIVTQFLLAAFDNGFYFIIGFAIFSICCSVAAKWKSFSN